MFFWFVVAHVVPFVESLVFSPAPALARPLVKDDQALAPVRVALRRVLVVVFVVAVVVAERAG